MRSPCHSVGARLRIAGWWALGAALIPWGSVHASRAINQQAPVDPSGSVEIVGVAGSFDVRGWERPQIDVTGTAGDGVERVDVTTQGTRSYVRVVGRSGVSWGGDLEANLVVHVPAQSVVAVSVVSADLSLKGLRGSVKLQTVSGNATGEVGGDLVVSTVSGDLDLAAPASSRIEAKTVSGDMQLSGGGGDVDITTISGDVKASFNGVRHGRFKSISGDLAAALSLIPGAEIDAESVSGGQSFTFATAPSAEFDVQTLSGDISNCFGPRSVEDSRYGPGSRLTFRSGEARGHVHIETKSGDVRLCTKEAASLR